MKSYLEGKKLNNIEKNKAHKDGLLVGAQIEEFSRIGWEKMDKTDLELRLKWYGIFWRPKTPGQFMMRLRIPNGILTSKQLRIIASIVARYGEGGSCDITTRQNLQLRGILINDLPEILRRIKEAGLETIQSGFDNPRNVTGNALAGVDPHEILDTRPYTLKLEKFLTNEGKGNSDFSNLPRKWNTAVAGSADNFLLHNDIIFHPIRKGEELGFGVWVGGILSSQLNDYAVPLDVWIKKDQISNLTGVIISIWRDNGERQKRQRGRFRYYLNEIGIPAFRELVQKRFGPLTHDPGSSFSEKPRSIFGVNPQKQENLYYAGIHIPVGRLNSEDLQDIATVSITYGSGEIRLTEDQNIIIINIPANKLNDFKNDILFNRFSINPNPISAGTIACTGKTYCSFAQVSTKENASKIVKELESEIELPEEVKIHWTGCPNSCAQAYMGAIGLTGTKAKNSAGIMVDAFNISIGGEQGENKKIGEIKYKGVVVDNLKDKLKSILIENYSAKPIKKKSEDKLNFLRNPIKLIHKLMKGSLIP